MKLKQQKLSVPIKRKITERWISAFPDFAVYKPMWLMKRNGPVLIGICLERFSSNDEYRPITHVHNLSRPTGFATLSIASQILDPTRRREMRLTAESSEQDIEVAIAQVKSQSTIPLTRKVLLNDILSAYRQYVTNAISSDGYPVFEYEDIVRLLTWCCKLGKARKMVEDIEVITRDWDPFVFRHVESREVYLRTLYHIVINPSDSDKVIADEIENLDAKSLPDYGLLCS
jgi:hypothetical protein